MKILPIIILSVVLASCVNQPNYLEHALNAAGTNRPELEKVLAHYKGDTLKYKAAVFLIENIPGHYSYAGNEVMEYYEIGEKILQSELTPVQQRDSLRNISDKLFPGLAQNTVSDISIMPAAYLIKNIDAAFELWETKPWAQHLSFEQFCEFLLPYKCVELLLWERYISTSTNLPSKNYIMTFHCETHSKILFFEHNVEMKGRPGTGHISIENRRSQ